MIAVSSGTCVGINALLSLLREKRQKGPASPPSTAYFWQLRQLSCICLMGIFSSTCSLAHGWTENREIVWVRDASILAIISISPSGIFMEMTF